MIKTFKNKGLKEFFESGSKKGIQPDHAGKLERMLDMLDAAITAKDMDLPAYKLHELKGKEKGIWSIWVNGNWRVAFKFENGDAYIVDYRDYH
jgi:proteic killer suppression protein